MKIASLSAAVLTALGLAASLPAAPAGPARPAAKAPKAATPEGAFKGFVAALEAGNVKAASACIAPPLDTVWANDLALFKAAISFEEALDQQFGKGAGKTPTTWKRIAGEHAATVRSVEKVGKGRARLTLWHTAERPEGKVICESTLEATLVDGSWKLHVPLPGSTVGARTRKEMRKGPDGKDVEARVVIDPPDELTAPQRDRLMKLTSASRAETARHTAAVRAGKFKTRAEAEEALQAALGALVRCATEEE